MLDGPDNPFAVSVDAPPEPAAGRSRSAASVPLILSGVVVGNIGLVLVSNRYGNTETLGLPVVAAGGLLLGTGVSSLFLKLRYSVVVGVLFAPVSVILLFVLFWVCLLTFGAVGGLAG